MNDEHARHYWQRHSIPCLDQGSVWIERNRSWIEEQASLHPGFGDALRSIALDALESEQPLDVRRALSALAVLGTDDDVPRLREVATERGGIVARDAGAAVEEIEKHRRTAQRRSGIG
jgi:hypothetical protein